MESAAQTVTIAGDEAMEVPFRLTSPMAPLPSPTHSGSHGWCPTREPPAGWNRPAEERFLVPAARGGDGLAVLGVASLVLGIVEHVSYFGKANDFKNAGCGTSNLAVGSGCKSLNDEFHSAQTWFVVGYVGAAVLGGAGAYFLWLTPTEPADTATGIASVGSGMTVNFQGRF